MKKCLILIIAVAFMAVSGPAMAKSDVSFYGQSWFATWWDKTDATNNGTAFSDTDSQWITDGAAVSRFGARFKDGPMAGGIEIGLREGRENGYASTRTRQVWGEYDFGSFKLLVGQTYEKAFMPFLMGARGGQGTYRGEGGIGTRAPMIRARFNVGPGELVVAAIDPNTSRGTSAGFYAGSEIDTGIPKLEIAYDAKVSNFRIQLCYSYQTYDQVQVSTNKDWDITSYALIGKVTATFGPLTIAGGMYTGENLREYGMGGTKGAYASQFDAANLRVIDNEQMGWALGAKFQVNSMFAVSAGYGEISQEQDAVAAGATAEEDDDKGYHISAFVNVAKNFDINFEYGVKDFEDARPAGGVAVDQGKAKYWGAEWILKF
jgi:hypothetical protein